MGFESKAKLCGFALALLISAGAAEAGDTTSALDQKKWHPWIEFGGYGSNEESRGEAVMFAPLWQSMTALLFTDIRGKVFEKDEFEGNAAVGLRAMQPSGWNLGAWVGWDIRHTEFDNTFNQVAFGFEAIRPDFDVRVNGYIPTDDNEFVARSDTFAALLAGNSIFIQQTSDIVREYALYGVDAEVGFRLPLEFWNTDLDSITHSGVPRHELRLYGGGFWFDQDDFEGEVAGPRARLEWRINDVIEPILGSRLTIEAEYQYDEIRDHQFEAGARLRIPFGGGGRDARNATLARLTAQERRMMDGLERDVDIIVEEQTDTTETLENAIDNETNVLFERVAYVGDGGDLQGTIITTGENSLVLLTGGTLDGDVTTRANQTLQGGASTIFIRGARTGVVVPFTAPGTKPTLQGVGILEDVLTIGGDNVHIAGLGIDGLTNMSEDGIEAGSGRTNIVLQQNMIMNTGDDGIDFDDNNSNIRIFDNMITNPGEDGIDFEGFNSDILIADNMIDIAEGGDETDGVDIAFGNTGIRIIGNIITVGDNNERGDGIEIIGGLSPSGDIAGNSDILIADNRITLGDDGEVSDGIYFEEFNSDITIVNNHITIGNDHDDTDGIFFFEENSNINIFNNIIRIGSDNLDSDGIVILEDNREVDIARNVITLGDRNRVSPGGFGRNGGIYIGDFNKEISILDNTINIGSFNEGINGVFVEFSNTDANISGNVISLGNRNEVSFFGLISSGIFFGGSNRDIIVSNNTVKILDENEATVGIFLASRNGDIDIHNNTIKIGINSIAPGGIVLGAENEEIDVYNNVVEIGSGTFLNAGVALVEDNRRIDIFDNTITVDGSSSGPSSGIYLQIGNTDIDVFNNNIRTGDIEPDASGIDLLFDNTGVLITGNMIRTGNLGDGIFFGISNDAMINGNVFNGPGNAVINSVGGISNSATGVNNVAIGTFTTPCIGTFTGSVAFNGFSCP